MFIAGDFFKMVPEREEEGLPAEYPAQALRDCLMDAESSRSSETPLAHIGQHSELPKGVRSPSPSPQDGQKWVASLRPSFTGAGSAQAWP